MATVDVQRTDRIFKKLLRIAPRLQETTQAVQSQVPGLLDLRLNVLRRTGSYMLVTLGNYWLDQSPRPIIDVEVRIAVYFKDRLAEALTYQDTHTHETAYPMPGEPPVLEVHTHINSFLEEWLDVLAQQGFVLPQEK